MSNYVYPAYSKYLTDKREAADKEYRSGKVERTGKGALWPTDLGKCHRAAILRVNGDGGNTEFTTRSLDYMNAGTAYEDVTADVLRFVYGDRLTEQVILKYKMWSGKADFGIDIGGKNPVLIEHKMTSERNWDADGAELPKHEHIGQALTYRWLYKQIYGITPIIVLFYKAWGNFAEFELSFDKGKVKIISVVNGIHDVKTYKYDVEAEIETLMETYNSGILPERLDKKYKGCTFMGKPSCRYYQDCWGE